MCPAPQSLYVARACARAYGAISRIPNYLDLRDRNRSFDGLAAYNITQAGLDTGKEPIASLAHTKPAGITSMHWALQPYLGRFFHAADEHGPNSAPYIVLSYAYWHTHFQDDRGVVGRMVQLNRHPFTILGVAPPDLTELCCFSTPISWCRS